MSQKVVLAIITYNKRILIGKIRQQRLANYANLAYVFPGGKVEDGETTEEATIREVHEETGLNVRIVELIDSRIHPLSRKELYYFHCVVQDTDHTPRVTPDESIESLSWIDARQLSLYMPHVNPEVTQYLEAKQVLR
jgi:8-oxo-dGTP diphosphatase